MTLYETFSLWAQGNQPQISLFPICKMESIGILRVNNNNVSFISPPPSLEPIVHKWAENKIDIHPDKVGLEIEAWAVAHSARAIHRIRSADLELRGETRARGR